MWKTWAGRDYFLNIFQYLCVLLAIVITFMTLAYTLGTDVGYPKGQFFMSNTYLAGYSLDNALATYSPISTPLSEQSISNTFYQCLMFAEVGIDDYYKCKSGSVEDYTTCINGLYTAERRKNRMVKAVRDILGSYKGDMYAYSQLPNILTSQQDLSGFAALTDSNRLALKTQLGALSSPLSTDILTAITTAEQATGVAACMNTVAKSSLKLSVVDGSKTVQNSLNIDVDSIFDYLWYCAADTVYTEPVQKIAYEKCTAQTAWPIKDVLQGPYSTTLMGSYNKYFVCIVAIWLLCSFLVYTLDLGVDGSKPTPNGKPSHALSRAGKGLVGFGLVWNVGLLILVFVVGFSSADYWPMSIQTLMISLFFTLSACIYFGRELYELFYLEDKEFSAYNAVQNLRLFAPAAARPMYTSRSLQGYMRVSKQVSNMELQPEQYLPLVAPVWSDALFFVDGLLFLAVVGTGTTDLVTADVVICVFVMLIIALNNSALVRLLYEGYVCEPPHNDDEKKATDVYNQNSFRLLSRQELQDKEQKALQAVRVMAVLSNFIGLLLQVIILYICIKRFGFNSVTIFVLLATTIPQLIWLALSFTLEFQGIEDASAVFTVINLIFLWNSALRGAFAWVIWANINVEYKKNLEDEDSLFNLFKMIGMEKPQKNSAGAITSYS
jgi:hypothetical protein